MTELQHHKHAKMNGSQKKILKLKRYSVKQKGTQLSNMYCKIEYTALILTHCIFTSIHVKDMT